jgi:AraC family transcriptional activator of mtrCDE
MQVARQLLTDTNASIIDIAEDVGYQSEAAFGRVFKKHFDIAPASYRRNRKILAA